MTKAIVIYYDGNENKAAVLDVPEHVGPNTAQPHVWGLPDDADILAVIACSLDGDVDEMRRVTCKNWHETVDVYVDEMLVIIAGEENEE